MDQQQIATLIHRYLDGTASDGEMRQLMQWYNAAEINEVEWPDANDNRALLRERMLKRLKHDVIAQRSKVFSLPKFTAAASLLIAAGVAITAYFMIAKKSISYVTLNNPAGKVQVVHLPDSSKVWLNAGTTLQYDQAFTTHRQILLDGEAYFEVTKDTAHPFTISTGTITTTVKGTSFTIKAYPGDSIINVSVLTGTVKVSDESNELALLMPIKSIRYNERNKKFIVYAADTTHAISWVRGYFQFKGESLYAITGSLGRWFGYTIDFMKPDAGNCRYYMSFSQHEPIENILQIIEQLTGLTYEINNNNKKITFYGDACH